jgi:hypothetical protein
MQAAENPKTTAGLNANQYQFGGIHYKTGYEHWDLVLRCDLGYLEGCATKYVARWRKTGPKGETDLKKAIHYVRKLQENIAGQRQRLPQRWLRQELTRFFALNGIVGDDLAIITALVTWETEEDLESAAGLIEYLITENFPPKDAPLEDSNKHADRMVPRF